MTSLRRAVTAAAARPRNDGAKPSESIAIAPDLRKMRREVIGFITGGQKKVCLCVLCGRFVFVAIVANAAETPVIRDAARARSRRERLAAASRRAWCPTPDVWRSSCG